MRARLPKLQFFRRLAICAYCVGAVYSFKTEASLRPFELMMDLMLETGFLGLKLLLYVLGKFKQVLFLHFWSFFEIFEDLLHSIKRSSSMQKNWQKMKKILFNIHTINPFFGWYLVPVSGTQNSQIVTQSVTSLSIQTEKYPCYHVRREDCGSHFRLSQRNG